MNFKLSQVIAISVSLLGCGSVEAEALRRGYILRDGGAKCWYTQNLKENDLYFHKKLVANTQYMVFDDPNCLKDKGIGFIAIKLMVNNIIVRQYTNEPEAMMTREEELFDSSITQNKGYCIQSKTHQIMAVAVDYVIKNKSIVSVVHASAVGPCTRKAKS